MLYRNEKRSATSPNTIVAQEYCQIHSCSCKRRNQTQNRWLRNARWFIGSRSSRPMAITGTGHSSLDCEHLLPGMAKIQFLVTVPVSMSWRSSGKITCSWKRTSRSTTSCFGHAIYDQRWGSNISLNGILIVLWLEPFVICRSVMPLSNTPSISHASTCSWRLLSSIIRNM